MTSDFWLRLVLAALMILGIWTIFLPDMLLGRVGDDLERRYGEFVCKPMISCPQCMSSFHGTLIWFLTGGSWTWWVPFVLALCGFLKILTTLVFRAPK